MDGWDIALLAGTATTILTSGACVLHHPTKYVRMRYRFRRKGIHFPEAVEDLFETTAQDWNYLVVREFLERRPFDSFPNLAFRLGTFKKNVWELWCIYNNKVIWEAVWHADENRLVKSWECERSTKDEMEDFFSGKGIFLMEHLVAIWKTKQEEALLTKKEKKKRDALDAQHTKESLIVSLRHHLSSPSFWNNETNGVFSAHKESKPYGDFYTLSMEGKRAATFMKTASDTKHHIVDARSREGEVVFACLPDILSSLHLVLIRPESMPEPKVPFSMPNTVQELQRLLDELGKEERWLTEEEKHLVGVTYPADIAKWLELKENAAISSEQDDFSNEELNWIPSVYETLLSIQQEANRRKKQALTVQKEVILRRSKGEKKETVTNS